MFHIFFGMERSRANVINMTSKVRMSVRCYYLLISIGTVQTGQNHDTMYDGWELQGLTLDG